jgi:hypothetical protein
MLKVRVELVVRAVPAQVRVQVQVQEQVREQVRAAPQARGPQALAPGRALRPVAKVREARSVLAAAVRGRLAGCRKAPSAQAAATIQHTPPGDEATFRLMKTRRY